MAYSSSDTIKAIIAAAKGVAGDDWMFLAQAMLSVAWMESGFNPGAVGDGNTSFGIFQLHYGGQADAFVAKYGHDALYNPYLQATWKASTMWATFKSMGGPSALQADPGKFVAEFEWQTQRPRDYPDYQRAYDAYQVAFDASDGDWSNVQPADPINLDPDSPQPDYPNPENPTTTDNPLSSLFPGWSPMSMPWESPFLVGGGMGRASFLGSMLGGYGGGGVLGSQDFLGNLVAGGGQGTGIGGGRDYISNLIA